MREISKNVYLHYAYTMMSLNTARCANLLSQTHLADFELFVSESNVASVALSPLTPPENFSLSCLKPGPLLCTRYHFRSC